MLHILKQKGHLYYNMPKSIIITIISQNVSLPFLLLHRWVYQEGPGKEKKEMNLLKCHPKMLLDFNQEQSDQKKAFCHILPCISESCGYTPPQRNTHFGQIEAISKMRIRTLR